MGAQRAPAPRWRRWPREILRQLTHPLALLPWLAAVLSYAVGSDTVAIAVLLVSLLNALFAFVQERSPWRWRSQSAGWRAVVEAVAVIAPASGSWSSPAIIR